MPPSSLMRCRAITAYSGYSVAAEPVGDQSDGFEGDVAGAYSRLDRLIRIDTAGRLKVRIA
jgi:hypothetical protein